MSIEEAIKILDYKINMYKEDVFIGDLDKTNIEAIKKVLKEIERLKADYQQANEILAEQSEEIERLKEEYVMLQNASDEVEEELQQRIDETLDYLDNSNMSFVDKNEIAIRLKGEESKENDFNN